MAGSDLIFRTAMPHDAEAMLQVERQSWPTELASTESQLRARIAVFPEGQFIAEQNGRPVGTMAAQRLTAEFLASNGDSYDRITDNGRFTNSHDPAGEIYQLIGVAVVPDLRGIQLGRQLVDRQIEFARSLSDVRRIVGFTRPARYHRHRDMPIDEYVVLRNDRGRLVDPVLSFHLDAGAKLNSVHPGFRPDDTKACGYGVLIEYSVD